MKSNSDTQRAVIYSVFCFLTFHSLNNVVVLADSFRAKSKEINSFFPPQIKHKENLFEFIYDKKIVTKKNK